MRIRSLWLSGGDEQEADEADRCEVEESSKQRVETSKGGFKLTQKYFFRNYSGLLLPLSSRCC
jgi:hypothetical protein